MPMLIYPYNLTHASLGSFKIAFGVMSLLPMLGGFFRLWPGWLLIRKCRDLVRYGVLTTGYCRTSGTVRFTTDRGKFFDVSGYFAPRFLNTPVAILYDQKNPYRSYFAPSSHRFKPIGQFAGACVCVFMGLLLLSGSLFAQNILFFIFDILLGISLCITISIMNRLHSRYCQNLVAKRLGHI
ncbi:MAG TPA: hypothetical protein VL461_07315 [Dictyobacter sp.]|nr:hypothetical protein [Dictyobacter sp.]